MDTNPNSVRYQEDLAVIRVSGTIDNDLIFWLADEVDHAIEYMCYDRIDLHIDSPGGDIGALDYYLTRLESWRTSRDFTLGTVGLTTVASAAAVVLSLGSLGYRRVYPSTRLLYHDPRIVSLQGTVWTHEQLEAQHRALAESNERLLNTLARHILKETDSSKPFRIPLPTRTDSDAHLDVASPEDMVALLATLSSYDRFITGQLAKDMRLIDRVAASGRQRERRVR